jgi:hypothetical protein
MGHYRHAGLSLLAMATVVVVIFRNHLALGALSVMVWHSARACIWWRSA